ncbi:MAG: hypothetical protein R2771_07960 [Saprospiraceae bacterium]
MSEKSFDFLERKSKFAALGVKLIDGKGNFLHQIKRVFLLVVSFTD